MTEHKPDRKFVKDVLDYINKYDARSSVQVAVIKEMCLEALYGKHPQAMDSPTIQRLSEGLPLLSEQYVRDNPNWYDDYFSERVTTWPPYDR